MQTVGNGGIMHNIMAKILYVIIGLFMATQNVHAVENLSIRLEEPKSPVNRTDLPVTFVVLDLIGGRNISVVCQKRFETEASFIQFGPTQTLSAGGNTGNCTFDSSILSNKGTYYIKVIATAGADTAEVDPPVSFVFNNDYPGDPRDYSKEKTDACLYKIRFKTADDSGKSVKVEVYRSSDTSFTANSGSRVTSIAVVSNTEYSYVDSIPDCNKTYYYGVRAFNSAGNGSGIVGDSETRITTKTTTTTNTTTGSTPTPKQGALTVEGGSILGITKESTDAGNASILGEASDAAKPTDSSSGQSAATGSVEKTVRWIIGGILVLIGAGVIGSRLRKKNESSVQ